jgi:ferritin-like metal-binding protein YciE
MATTEKSGIKKSETQTTGTESKSGSEKQKTLKDLLENGLKYMYSGETQMKEAMPKVAEAVYSEELQDTLREHLQESKRHVERLEKIFNRLGIDKTKVEKCKITEAMIENCNKIIEEIEEGPVRDSALIIAIQKIEHHEIASYGSLCELADVLGNQQVCDLLDRTLEEEERADKMLTDIAYDINDEAYETSQDKVYEDA